MYAAERQQRIADLIAADGRASVADLAANFGVTSETVRRDLDTLEGLNALRRVHGGAVAPDHDATFERTFAQREAEHLPAKRAAADAAMRFIPRDTRCSILLDAGSTTALVAERLAGLPARTVEELTVVCNSLELVQRLAANPAITIVMLGGRFRSITGAVVGPVTVDQLASLRPDVAFLGTNGLSASFGCSTPDPDEAAVKRAMVRGSRRRILVTDDAKFEEETLVRFAAIDELDAVATNRVPVGDLAAALADADVEVATP